MQDDPNRFNGFCRSCGCNEPQAAADAQTLGLQKQFQAGMYSCCQVVKWADEQWLAWLDAATEDEKIAEDITRPLEVADSETVFAPVRAKHPSVTDREWL